VRERERESQKESEKERERACEWRKLFQNAAQFRETDVVELAKKYL